MAASPPLSQRPFLLGLVGLALMIGGWKASVYIPITAHEAEQDRLLADLRSHADDPELANKLRPYTPHTRRAPPPFLVLGRIAFFGGFILFVAAGFIMYRQPPPSEKDATEEPDSAEAKPSGHLIP
jgi:hypothetical protein